MKRSVETLSAELRNKAMVTGNEWGWKLADVPQVVAECQKLNYAILGGQAQFVFPEETCRLHWFQIDPIKWAPFESWDAYSKRSGVDFLEMFDYLVKTTDFKKAGVTNFPLLEAKTKAGVNILDHLYFTISPVSQENHPQMPKGFQKG